MAHWVGIVSIRLRERGCPCDQRLARKRGPAVPVARLAAPSGVSSSDSEPSHSASLGTPTCA